ncbi:hypothetical protein PHYNN_162 [Pantoea phage Phynn]|nr:hypothetical protein PHYNN_162 [Pantoea phage Phynn]
MYLVGRQRVSPKNRKLKMKLSYRGKVWIVGGLASAAFVVSLGYGLLAAIV